MKARQSGVLATLLLVCSTGVAAENAWFEAGAASVAEQNVHGKTRARNVVLFVGDGMGVSTVTAARILAGQMQGAPGEEHLLSFEEFPQTALVKTYAVNRQVADSASTMTAIVTGIKTGFGTLSVDEHATVAGCLDHDVPTLLEQAEDAGLATGVVSTARLTHATPAATYAHAVSRGWEADVALPEEAVAAGCKDIAAQLLDFDHGDGLDVALGGGFPAFVPEAAGGVRKDGRHLIKEWLTRRGATYAGTTGELRRAKSAPLLGLFGSSHMTFESDRDQGEAGQPSLTEMTDKALDLLEDNRKGFLLIVEGGRIDHGHHGNSAYHALHETVEMARAVARVRERVGKDTLIIVTADHSHVMTMSGYPARGNPILGRASETATYTTLGYANGPGYVAPDEDGNHPPSLDGVDTEAADYRQFAGVPLSRETHGGEDVAAYAVGPGSQYVRGVLEQNVLYHVMARALFGKRRR